MRVISKKDDEIAKEGTQIAYSPGQERDTSQHVLCPKMSTPASKSSVPLTASESILWGHATKTSRRGSEPTFSTTGLQQCSGYKGRFVMTFFILSILIAHWQVLKLSQFNLISS